MHGGTTSTGRFDLNNMKQNKRIQGVNPTRSSPKLVHQPKDTKLTLISQGQMDSLKAQINPPRIPATQSYQQVLSGGIWGPPLSSPVWNTTSETMTCQPKSPDHIPLHNQHGTSVLPKVQEEIKVLYVADSIGQNCDLESASEDAQTNIVTVRAYSAVYDEKANKPKENVEDVISKELTKESYNYLIMQAPSVDITNLGNIAGNCNDHYLRQEASSSSFNMIKAAERALHKD